MNKNDCCGNCEWCVYYSDLNKFFCYRNEVNIKENDEPCILWTPIEKFWHDF